MRITLSFLLVTSPALAAEPIVHRDLAYVEPKNERQTLDVYAPAEKENSAEKARPIVFWIHGGGWEKGDKSGVQAKPQAFVDKGCLFVATNYRFWPNVTIGQIAQDLAKAIRWTHDHAKEYGGDPNTIFVMGHSAGAQLAALLCTDERYLKAEGLSLSMIKGCVPVDGDTYDVPLQLTIEPPGTAQRHAEKFGDEASQKNLSPVTHVAKGKGIPPFLILHITDNPLTGVQANRLAAALKAADVPVQVVSAEGKTHGTINSDLGTPDDKSTHEMWKFLDRALKK
ncbi:MAG TPA: alpha/beta hydrolase [Pirellulales bacterium]|jgi:acetyl esterase/lipase|nr:alpha/beta hydrolase [Pirellulales bacterium]